MKKALRLHFSFIMRLCLPGMCITATDWSSSEEYDEKYYRCYIEADAGRCKAAIPRWSYNASSKACTTFIYGGCDANENNFYNKSDCNKFCRGFVTNPCILPIEPARKRSCNTGITVRYGYNPQTKKCEKFLWSSCTGNINNFTTRKQCWKTCAPESPCLLKTEYHRYRFFRSYFYDADHDSCNQTRTFLKKQYWPTENRFQSTQKCKEECMPDHFDSDIGPLSGLYKHVQPFK
uniref:Tissue factor pathway inhibitor n=1 Tax=Rhipicephalus appendiculatus TaxID=34631 RepID=A0A131Z5P3_RHIAP